MEGAEQILNEMNSLHASFDDENPTLLNLEELIPSNLATTTSSSSAQNRDLKPQVPIYPYMQEQIPNSKDPSWESQNVANNERNATTISGPSAPMMNLGHSDTIPLNTSLPSGENMPGQGNGMVIPDYGNGGTVMQMQQADVDNGQLSAIDARGKEVSGMKRNTMSNWTSSLSWTKAPRVLVVEDDAVS